MYMCLFINENVPPACIHLSLYQPYKIPSFFIHNFLHIFFPPTFFYLVSNQLPVVIRLITPLHFNTVVLCFLFTFIQANLLIRSIKCKQFCTERPGIRWRFYFLHHCFVRWLTVFRPAASPNLVSRGPISPSPFLPPYLLSNRSLRDVSVPHCVVYSMWC